MKNKTIISIALLILVITPLVSASIGGGRSIINPLGRSHLNNPLPIEENLSEEFNNVLSEIDKDNLRLENNLLIKQKAGIPLINNDPKVERKIITDSILNNTIEKPTEETINISLNDFDLFIICGIIILIFFLFLALNQGDNKL